MQPSPTTGSPAIPGMRIPNYRNSARRAIRLIGLGAAASELVGRIAQRGLPNVAIMTHAAAIDWRAVAGDATDRDLNLIVIVCHESDARLFRPVGDRPAVLVTFVLLQSKGDLLARGEPRHGFAHLERARAFSDLFVSTSDADYVSELIGNLAS
jgi:hypothetical protein